MALLMGKVVLKSYIVQDSFGSGMWFITREAIWVFYTWFFSTTCFTLLIPCQLSVKVTSVGMSFMLHENQ